MTAEVLARSLGLRRIGRSWRGACPVHGGSSFTVTERDDKILFCCWSGCDREAILTELRSRGLWPEPYDHRGMTAAERRQRAQQRSRDLKDGRAAGWWRISATVLAEVVLEDLDPWDLRRMRLTRLLGVLRNGLCCLSVFRRWREAEPELTACMIAAGRAVERRQQTWLAEFVAGLEVDP
ncbi:MAG: hypothetical protein JXA57_03040 [Armatimonadetes bacterium]|nr:hypothetical protein [Armatimonadota bacterium]